MSVHPDTAKAIQLMIFGDVEEERDRQDKLWGQQPRSLSEKTWFAILGEEVGEVAKAVVEDHEWEHLRTELTHVAAVAIAAIEDGDLNYGRPA